MFSKVKFSLKLTTKKSFNNEGDLKLKRHGKQSNSKQGSCLPCELCMGASCLGSLYGCYNLLQDCCCGDEDCCEQNNCDQC